jgi:hypothetical protein
MPCLALRLVPVGLVALPSFAIVPATARSSSVGGCSTSAGHGFPSRSKAKCSCAMFAFRLLLNRTRSLAFAARSTRTLDCSSPTLVSMRSMRTARPSTAVSVAACCVHSRTCAISDAILKEFGAAHVPHDDERACVRSARRARTLARKGLDGPHGCERWQLYSYKIVFTGAFA